MRHATSSPRLGLRSICTVAACASVIAFAATGCAVQSQTDGSEGPGGGGAHDPGTKGHHGNPIPVKITPTLDPERLALDPKSEHGLEKTRLEIARLPEGVGPASGTPAPDTKISVPLYWPNITAVRDDRDVWKYDARYGWYPAIATGFTINNVGNATSAGFRVSILNGAASRGFDVPPMAPHTSVYYELTSEVACGATAVVIADPFNAIWESSYSDNVANVPGICYW
jgi:hypothetical protein